MYIYIMRIITYKHLPISITYTWIFAWWGYGECVCVYEWTYVYVCMNECICVCVYEWMYVTYTLQKTQKNLRMRCSKVGIFWAVSLIWMSLTCHIWHGSYMNELFSSHKWVMCLARMSHVSHANISEIMRFSR